MSTQESNRYDREDSALVVSGGAAGEWIGQIDECIAVLEALNEKTEGGFISVGSQLQQIYVRIRNISDSLTVAMTKFTGKGRDEVIGKLRQIMDASSRYLSSFDHTSSRAVTQLTGLVGMVEALPDALKEFDRLVSQLRIMGITTRIETERLGLTNMGFEHLAEEVTTLGETISHKAKEVHSSLRTIIAIGQANQRRLADLRTKHHVLQESVTREMNLDMQLLSEKHEALMKAVEDVTIHSQDAVRTLDVIVEAIQFHDITRQQIEHVVEALKNLRGDLVDPASEEQAASHLIVVCELQPAQLERARAEYTSAVLSMISSFGSLSNAIRLMQDESKDAIGFAGGEGTTFFGVVGTNLQSVTSALTEGESAIDEFLASIGQISAVVEKMRLYMDEMGEVGIEVELLALNSRIRSAKALERGAALGVIAESIQQISNTARLHIDGIVGSIASLVAATEEIESDARNARGASSSQTTIADLTRELGMVISVFETSSVAGTEILRNTETVARALGGELEQLAENLRAKRQDAETMMMAQETLAALAREARIGAPDLVLEEVEARLVELRERYTMHSERELHEAYLEGRSMPEIFDDAAGGSIELF